ncbi:MAG: hypothetical protein JWN71_867 [Xanthobacteraceae bacterium]|jgi:hypothetical protein|nr:hypothetical protein [Xanthobacteraceae bacterium]
MPDRVTFQPVEVAVAGQTDGRLVFVDGKLVAVLVKLDGSHDDLAGRWYAEAAFNSLERMSEHTFADLPAAVEWIASRHRAKH